MPFVSAQAGPDVWRTVPPFTPEPEAAAFAPRVLAERTGAAFMMMGVEAALAGSRKTLAAEPACALASLEFDDLTTRNGRAERAIRFWVHERGTPWAFLFSQPYDPPARGRALVPRGPLGLLRPVAPLFPA
jgi:hypothetical protein